MMGDRKKITQTRPRIRSGHSQLEVSLQRGGVGCAERLGISWAKSTLPYLSVGDYDNHAHGLTQECK